MAPVLFQNKLKSLAIPVDFGREWKGKPIFGKNKTYRGFVVGIILAAIVVFIQTLLFKYPFFQELSLIPYDQINFLLLGFLLGFGVLFGDLMESAVKRRLGKKPGESFFPWDQLDHLFGGLLFLMFVYFPPLDVIIMLIVLAISLSVIIKHVGYYLGIEKTKW